MSKQPYIPFYTGDYIKDTRKLPLAVRGAWMDLLLFMWDEEVRGEIIATIQEFAGMLSCSTDECDFALNLLIQKKVCSYEKFADGRIKIISRRMKKDTDISLKRSESGNKGVIAKRNKKQNLKFGSAKDKQNPDIDYVYDNDNKEIETIPERVETKGMLKISEKMAIPENVLEVVERNQFTLTSNRNTKFIKDQWVTFLHERMNDPPAKKSQYRQLHDLTSYFINWIRNKHPKINGKNSGHTQTGKPIPTGNVEEGNFGQL